MEQKFVVAGIGGQGVIFATKVLSKAALLCGERVLASENHGMSQRGGSVLSHVKIGSDQSPLIRRGTADVLLAFDRLECIRNLPFVRAGGRVFVNSSEGFDSALTRRLGEIDVGLHALDADAAAKELGSPAAANLIVIGFAAANNGLGFTLDDLSAAIRALGPAKAAELNLKALEIGAQKAAQRHETV